MKLPALQQVLLRRALPLACVVLLAFCPGCGGPATTAPAVSPLQPGLGSTPATESGKTAPAQNILSTRMPALQRLKAGAELEFSISARCTDELYQGCGRVQYDPAIMQPVAAVRGPALPAGYLFAAKLDAAPAASAAPSGLPALSGSVPFAFTGLPTGTVQHATAGELCRVRFRLLRDPGAQAVVRLLNTPEYLQLRGPRGNRIAFDLESEVTAQ